MLPGAVGRRVQPCRGCCCQKQVGQRLPGGSGAGCSGTRGFPQLPAQGRGTVAIWQPGPPLLLPAVAPLGPGWGKWVSREGFPGASRFPGSAGPLASGPGTPRAKC